MPFTRYKLSCVARCNHPQSSERRTGHHTANVDTASFPPPSTICPHQHLRNDLLPTINRRLLPIDPAEHFSFLADYRLQRKYACIVRLLAPPLLVFSTNVRSHTEASFTTTRNLPKRHWEQFNSSKSNGINSPAAFPDSMTPNERSQTTPQLPIY